LFEGLVIALWWNWDIIFFTLVGYEDNVLVISTVESSPEMSVVVQRSLKVIFWINIQGSSETMAFSVDRNFYLVPNSERNCLSFVDFDILF